MALMQRSHGSSCTDHVTDHALITPLQAAILKEKHHSIVYKPLVAPSCVQTESQPSLCDVEVQGASAGLNHMMVLRVAYMSVLPCPAQLACYLGS